MSFEVGFLKNIIYCYYHYCFEFRFEGAHNLGLMDLYYTHFSVLMMEGGCGGLCYVILIVNLMMEDGRGGPCWVILVINMMGFPLIERISVSQYISSNHSDISPPPNML